MSVSDRNMQILLRYNLNKRDEKQNGCEKVAATASTSAAEAAVAVAAADEII